MNRIAAETTKLKCGVLQGSVMGPLQFCIYMLSLFMLYYEHGWSTNKLKTNERKIFSHVQKS